MIFAKTADDLVLPVIDVTDPAFALPDDPASLAAQREVFERWDRERPRLPKFITRLLLRAAARRSPLVRTLFHSQNGYLDSISTYVMKLGAAHLPAGFDGPVDRKIAAAPPVMLVRLRMQQIATLLAQGLVEPLQQHPAAPLCFLNIAGGPALDSINAVILLRRSHSALLARPIAIHVLDAGAEGPAFGANALAALQAPGGPLAGLDIELRHQPYDWNDTGPLARLAGELARRGDVMAASSEGGLFEYGDDDAIVGNLQALAGAGVPWVAGSVTSASATRKRMIEETRFRLFPRGLEGFAPLAARGGYTLAHSLPAVLSDQVFLQLVA